MKSGVGARSEHGLEQLPLQAELQAPLLVPSQEVQEGLVDQQLARESLERSALSAELFVERSALSAELFVER